ncbi:energy-coupling factor ABC transporter substrate-binding protein [Mycolicibacterium nivoides]|uniref:Cobalt transport protein CbiN n=1 Tax=Mycolicibacterium nivoides TaxID=2487344 RepID=A0ABW9LJZ0_9MYCO
MRNSRIVTAALVAAIIAIFVVCLTLGWSGSSEEAFVGTDSAAVGTIENDHPDYQPWYDGLFTPPSAEVESGLFALQAAIGAGVLGYTLGVLRRRQSTRKVDSVQ